MYSDAIEEGLKHLFVQWHVMEEMVLDTFQIESIKAAAMLEHPRSRQILLGVVQDARSLQELADVTGLSLSLLHYHVKRLQQFGLIWVERKDRRSGRPVKRYRAVARRFLVPTRFASRNGTAELGRKLRAGLDREQARGGGGGVAYFVDSGGIPRMMRVPMEGERNAFEIWVTVFLTRQEMKDLSGELRALFARYAQPNRNSARPTIGYCAFAPDSDAKLGR